LAFAYLINIEFILVNKMQARSRKASTDIGLDSMSCSESDVNSIRGASVVGRRKALGDITNNILQTENNAVGKDLPKKATAAFSQLSVSEIKMEEVPQLNQNSLAQSPGGENERAYMRREADDIDIRDIGNPLLCTSVVNEMYEWFGDVEKGIITNSNYMSNAQPHINEKMRCILVDWLVSYSISVKIKF